MGKPWFAPRRHGYGASLPISWEGWLTLATFVGGIWGVLHFSSMLPTAVEAAAARFAGIVVLVVLLFAVTRVKTDGNNSTTIGNRCTRRPYMSYIYKIVHKAEWEQAERQGIYAGSEKDREDGFLHFSSGHQLMETLNKYYAESDHLVLVAVDSKRLGKALKFEPSRDGTMFPHFYGTLPLSSVSWVKPIHRGAAGERILPAGCE